jgi:hypothetical protein
MCMKSHQGIWYFAFLFISYHQRLLSGVLSRYEIKAYLHHIFLRTQKPDLKEMQVICASVLNFYKVIILNIFGTI